MNKNEKTATKEKTENQTFRINQSLFDRIEKHLLILKSIENEKHNKQSWIYKAIKEKLEREQENNYPKIPQKKTLSVRVDLKLKKN